MKYFFKRNHLRRHQFYCFNCVIKKLFVKLKNVYFNELQKSIYDEVINTQKQSFRSSSKKGVLQNFSNFAEKIMCTEGLKACNFVKRLQHRCFTVKFAKILRTPPVAAYELCPGGCFRIVSVSKYIIISSQCIKVSVS